MQSKIIYIVCDFDNDFDNLFAICQFAIVFQVSVVTIRSPVKTNTNKNRRNHRKSGRKLFLFKLIQMLKNKPLASPIHCYDS